MIRALSNLVEGGVELIEAEGRLASVHAVRLLTLAVIWVALALLGIAAVLCIGAGVVLLLAPSVGLGAAMVITGLGAAVCFAAVGAWAHQGLAGA
ncbi:MAG: hypothetical protein ACTS3F_05395 [Phycisphaerales bacterium]